MCVIGSVVKIIILLHIAHSAQCSASNLYTILGRPHLLSLEYRHRRHSACACEVARNLEIEFYTVCFKVNFLILFVKVCIGIKPNTSVEAVMPFVKLVDMVLVDSGAWIWRTKVHDRHISKGKLLRLKFRLQFISSKGVMHVIGYFMNNIWDTVLYFRPSTLYFKLVHLRGLLNWQFLQFELCYFAGQTP